MVLYPCKAFFLLLIISPLFFILFYFAGIGVDGVLKFDQYLFTMTTIFTRSHINDSLV